MSARQFTAWLVLSALAAWGCTSTTELARNFAGSGGSSASGAAAGSFGLAGVGGSAGAAGSAGGSCQVSKCQNKIYACGDCVDNDGDGKIDADDVECTGPCDDTEDSFFGGIPGANNAPCRQDCYFDGDTGSGNDGCDWSYTCDPLSLAPAYPPSGDASCAYDPSASLPGGSASCTSLALAQDPMCLQVCLPLTPNGCDCFGCCELPAGSGSFVWLGSMMQAAGSCDESTLGDPTLCHPCTPVKSCFNACEPCEHCVGRPAAAADCTSNARCPESQLPCGEPGDAACASGSYCITGCCQLAPR